LKLGSENRTKTIVAVVLLVIALAVIANAFFGGGGTGSSSTPAVAPGAPVAGTAPPRKGRKIAAARSLDPTLRYDWLKASEDKKYEGNSRNIFRAEAEIPQPVAPVASQQPSEPVQQGPPPPPPINLKFFGFANNAGEPKKIFLSQGEDVFIAREGDIVDRRYRVVHISPTSVEIEDVLNNNRQSIPLTQG
jgi:hypothetical protein